MQSGPLAGQGGVKAWGQHKRGEGGCSAINRHKNKLQLPSMNKFPCNLLCILFFFKFLMWAPPSAACTHKSICRLGDPPLKRHLKFSFINRSQSGAAFLGFGFKLELELKLKFGYLVSVFTLFLSFTRSPSHSAGLLLRCVLLPFVRIYCLYQTAGQEAWQAVQYTNCVCCKVYRSRKHLCVYRLGLSMILLGIPWEETIEFPSYHRICLHTLHLFSIIKSISNWSTIRGRFTS